MVVADIFEAEFATGSGVYQTPRLLRSAGVVFGKKGCVKMDDGVVLKGKKRGVVDGPG